MHVMFNYGLTFYQANDKQKDAAIEEFADRRMN